MIWFDFRKDLFGDLSRHAARWLPLGFDELQRQFGGSDMDDFAAHVLNLGFFGILLGDDALAEKPFRVENGGVERSHQHQIQPFGFRSSRHG